LNDDEETDMKAFLILLALVLVLVVAGWLTFGRSDGKPAVILETEQIQQDTEEATEKGKELLHEATQKVEELRNDDSPSSAGAATSTPSDQPGRDDRDQADQPADPQ
jgi:hypothetical protein